MRRISYYLIGLILFVFGVAPASAQQNTIITLGLPSWMESMVYSDDQLLAEFQALYPNVNVEIVPLSNIYEIPLLSEDIDGYFEAMEELASTADVLFVQGNMLTPESTTAGYFLNLQPLADTDSNLDDSDYYPAALNAYRWDRGLWAIPLRYEVNTLIYNPVRFDSMGLSYPNGNWTVDDFANAVRVLTEFDSSGAISQSAVTFGNEELIFLARALAGQGFYDSTLLPNAPRFDDPNLEYVIDTLYALLDEGYMDDFQGDFQNIAMMFAPPWVVESMSFGPDSDVEFRVTLLPGNTALPNVEGVAVSSGTAYPELAYDLARTFAQAFEQNYVTISPRRDTESQMLSDLAQNSPELLQIVEQALENGLPYSELRFSNYLNNVFINMSEDNLSAQEALENLMLEAQANLDESQARASSMNIIVQQPDLPPELATGQFALRFGMNMGADEIINRDAWEQVADEFAATHPEVGYVDLVDRWIMDDELASMDCFYRSYNDIPFLDLSTLIINVDPFLDSDPNFDENDLIGDVLTQVQRDGLTWGIPMTIRPVVIQYEKSAFEDAGLPLPQNDWSGAVFAETLRVLAESADEDAYPYLLGSDVMNVLSLVAAFDGLPYDLASESFTANFTDLQNVQAIQSVLDLAVEGDLAYLPIFDREGGDFRVNEIYMYNTTLSAGTFQYVLLDEEQGADAGFVLFPQGQLYTPVRYDTSVGMISASTPHAELCYDWLMTIAHRTDLYYEMPVFNSTVNNPALEVAQGAELAALYRQFAERMNDPAAFVIPNGLPGDYAGFLEATWLAQIFDAYVAEDGDIDLEAELAQAQTYVEDFRACVQTIEPIDWNVATPEEGEAQIQAFQDCARQADAEWEDPFSNRRGG
ncbi:MAG: extracellular solute-binding protein [Aggregatilineales bacterium]